MDEENRQTVERYFDSLNDRDFEGMSDTRHDEFVQTDYLGPPLDAPAWRAQWVERME